MKFRFLFTLLFALCTSFHTQAQWLTETLPDGRSEIASVAIGDNIYFVGGSLSGTLRYFKMNIYNVPSQTWKTVDVPNGTRGPRTIAIDKKIYFGDIEGDRTIYVYDTELESWEEISVPGFIGTLTHMDNWLIVESGGDLRLYDLTTEEWTEFDFDYNPYGTVTATNGKIVLAGGEPNIVRIYDVASDSWTETALSLWRDEPRAISHGNRMFFIGGETEGFSWSGVIDIYDTETDTWTTDRMSQSRNRFDVTIHNDKLIIAGGQIISFSDQWRNEVDILDLNTDTWTTVNMPTGRRYPSVIGHEDLIYIAGGDDQEDNLDVIEIYSLTSSVEDLSALDISVFPNPASEILWIETSSNIEHVDFMDVSGRVMKVAAERSGKAYKVDITKMESGISFLSIDGQRTWTRFTKL